MDFAAEASAVGTVEMRVEAMVEAVAGAWKAAVVDVRVGGEGMMAVAAAEAAAPCSW